MKIKHVSLMVLCSVFSALLAVFVYSKTNNAQQVVKIEESNEIPVQQANWLIPENTSFSFTEAAGIATQSVVHVQSKIVYKTKNDYPSFDDEMFRWFFGNPQESQERISQASGSGVIVSKDGYIVTNNHVIEDAHEIEITLSNNKAYKAELIGRDADTDIALIKVDANNLPVAGFANSDNVKIGEWVLAVGNPFNLSSTVTAGIVSAKGRNINILNNGTQKKANTAIESFIQTDAAVNPGNSGGALVNINGELIGINTAIASPTGAYAGYSFAVPSNLVQKVVEDLKEYGIVQRGFLGVNIRDVDQELANEIGLNTPKGVFVDDIVEGSAADNAGLKKKDVITKINGASISSVPELQQEVAENRPGDMLTIEYLRNGVTKTATVQLKNKYNNVEAIGSKNEVLNVLGLELEEITAKEKMNYRIDSGVKITDINKGKLKDYTDIREGFVITMIDDEKVSSIDEFIEIISNKKGKVIIEGVYPNDDEFAYLYAFKM